MFFFSETDPNYRIKGSRDPLGFQTLWSAAGHQAIAHLSTVSANLRDFMILAYGYYFYGDRPENRFLNFFLRFEQVCAYARLVHNVDKAFNGIDFVNKKKDDLTFSISLNPSDMLLSNQRTYGIYGKYTRPVRDMGFTKADSFPEVMGRSLAKSDQKAVQSIINKLLSENQTTLARDEIKPIAELLRMLTPDEKELYRNFILQVPDKQHPQNNLYELVHKNQKLAEGEFNLHATIQALQKEQGIADELNYALENIRNTDIVLFPLNRCFTHLLSESSWTEREILDDPFMQQLPQSLNCHFQDETMQELNRILSLDCLGKAEAIIQRNETVKQGKGAWIVKEKGVYKVIYGENGQKQQDLDFTNDYEFPYFLNTWLNLYKQIELS